MEQVKALVNDVLEENTDAKVVALANVTEALADGIGAVQGFGEALPHHVRKALEGPMGQVNFFLKQAQPEPETETEPEPETEPEETDDGEGESQNPQENGDE